MTPHIPRRTVLAGTAATAVSAAALTGTSPADAAPPQPPLPPRSRPSRFFAHGVASGDPRPTTVTLWTRVTPTPASRPGSGAGPRARVTWEVATDRRMRDVVRRGAFVTGPARDHTVKLDAGGLRPETWYYYRFTFDGHRSRLGRTRTAPAAHADPTHLRLGFVSCANIQCGWFAAYRHLARRNDLHAVVHLGDYFYEYGADGHGMGADDVVVRPHLPRHEILTLADYRQRHAQYKTDPDLQDLHAAYPMIATWDDHEVANDEWSGGAANHTEGGGPDGEGRFAVRRAQAHRAYDEWIPARLDGTVALRDGTRLNRGFRFGRLASLSMLDLRTFRDRQLAGVEDGAPDPDVDEPSRTITGRAQLDWLKRRLDEPGVRWKLVGNPVLIAPLSLAGLPTGVAGPLGRVVGAVPGAGGVPLNTDAWDGYTDDRRELFAHIASRGIDDVVFLTGDIHTGLAADLPLDKGAYPLGGTAGVEFVCASVTSNNFKDDTDTPPHTTSDAIAVALRAQNLHFTYTNLDDHGYCVLDVRPEHVRCHWFVVGARDDPHAGVRSDGYRETLAGSNRITRGA